MKSTLLWTAVFVCTFAFGIHAMWGVHVHFPTLSAFLLSHGWGLVLLAYLIWIFWDWACEQARTDRLEREMHAADDEVRDHLRGEDLTRVINPEDMEIIRREVQ